MYLIILKYVRIWYILHAKYSILDSYVLYRDPVLSASELSTKLEQAFLSGLKFSQPQMRMKFFEVFDSSIHQKLYERLVYITCSQNWEHFNHHFWIKQCIEVVM